MCLWYTVYEVIRVTIGERIREVRKSKNLTQKQLGELSGIAEPTIRRYELGKLNPKRETIAKIAKALEVHPVELSGDLFNEALLSVLKGSYETDEEFQAAFLSNKISFARLYDDTDKRLIQFYDMLNDRGRTEAVDFVFELSQQSEYLKDIYTKSPEELRKLQEDSKPLPYPPIEKPPQD